MNLISCKRRELDPTPHSHVSRSDSLDFSTKKMQQTTAEILLSNLENGERKEVLVNKTINSPEGMSYEMQKLIKLWKKHGLGEFVEPTSLFHTSK